MCSISASFDTDTLNDLIKLNSYRGTLSHSISRIYDDHIKIMRKYGELTDKVQTENRYTIVHQQAPTTKKSVQTNIHPAHYKKDDIDTYLWHNGIIKEECVKHLQKIYEIDNSWDTYLILDILSSVGRTAFNYFDGSFACLMYVSNHTLFVFRNEIAPLFYDEKLNFSSTVWGNCKSLPPNVFYEVDLISSRLIPLFQFKTLDNPYILSEKEQLNITINREFDNSILKDYDPYQ